MESIERRRLFKRYLVALLFMQIVLASYLLVRIWDLQDKSAQVRAQRLHHQENITKRVRTVKFSQPTDFLYLSQQQYQAGGARSTSAQAHWNIAASALLYWESPADYQQNLPGNLGDEGATPIDADEAVYHLLQAAEMGHASAQVLVAQAMETGYWLTDKQPKLYTLEVPDDIEATTTAKSWVYLHMAATAGEPEAVQRLAHRTYHRTTCNESLPYFETAADIILDQLEADPQSRAKVTPASDKHFLHQIWTHGGTPSKLEAHNKPDETDSFLEFYKIRVTDGDHPSSPQAAFTLANFYHYGLRGVSQNLTLAAQYYEAAALRNHWEAAGQAGKMYFWGIGVRQDFHKAHRMFQIGIPTTLEGCKEKHQEKLRQAKSDADKIHGCDPGCLNGMGLLRLFGLPMVAAVDLHLAEEYFKLARDQGNTDAAYNLAMMRLGWKTHYKPLYDVTEDGSTSIKEDLFAVDTSKHYLSQGEFQSILSDLNMAASKGVLQARHRLAKMHTYGVKTPVRGSIVQVVTQDCNKALKHYKWILDNASPQRTTRLRRAYKQYTAGELADSLRNYLMASELGSDSAQVNAAFLLERGECLGMDSILCTKASARLWKAASKRGDAEASLRVGDIYYYGKLRTGKPSDVGPSEHFRSILYPERLVFNFVTGLKRVVLPLLLGHLNQTEDNIQHAVQDSDDEAHLERDLQIASRYYRTAAEVSQSPRANFNLGYMYEWGLGLPQDFHLAKRHYDLAVSGPSKQGEVPVAIALCGLQVHKFLARYTTSVTSFFQKHRFFLTEKKISKTIKEGQLGNGNYDDMVLQLAMMHMFSVESMFLLIAATVLLTRVLIRFYSVH